MWTTSATHVFSAEGEAPRVGSLGRLRGDSGIEAVASRGGSRQKHQPVASDAVMKVQNACIQIHTHTHTHGARASTRCYTHPSRRCQRVMSAPYDFVSSKLREIAVFIFCYSVSLYAKSGFGWNDPTLWIQHLFSLFKQRHFALIAWSTFL